MAGGCGLTHLGGPAPAALPSPHYSFINPLYILLTPSLPQTYRWVAVALAFGIG